MPDPRAIIKARAKQLAKQALRPVALPVLARLDARVTALVSTNVHESPDLVAARQLQEYVPVVLNNVASQNAALREAKRAEIYLRESVEAIVARLEAVETRAREIAERGEFTRREMLYEIRYGGGRPAPEAVTEARIIDEDKVIAAKDDLRLNLGCGHIPLDRYINVDSRALEGVDVVADIRNLPFDPGTVSEIASAHMLEHFAEEELARALLPYWFGLLKPGGTFRATVPDVQTMVEEYVAGRVPFDEFRRVMYGDQEYDGDYHFTAFTVDSLGALLTGAGFDQVTLVENARRNGICYEMEIVATKPGDTADRP